MPSSIVLFQENLRLSDNPALCAAVESSNSVLPLFVLDDATPGDWKLGGASRWWLHHSLSSLQKALNDLDSKLIFRKGDTVQIVADLIGGSDVDAVYFQRAYAPWSAALESSLKELCDSADITCKRYGGHLLFEPESIRTKQGNPYTVFTPFWRACQESAPPPQPSAAPSGIKGPRRWPESLSLDDLSLLPNGFDWTAGLADTWSPGEAGAAARLKAFLSDGVSEYKEKRDLPAQVHATSMLSPHLRFGEISARAIWWRVMAHAEKKSQHTANGMHFLRELAWRDFSYHLLFNTPDLPEQPLKKNFAAFPWADDQHAALKRWQKGQTGYPIVDAGMRQLWQTGYMHNRVRMIVASFLIKDLLIDWRDGEAWFWDTLVDADIANNSASWQWVAGCGADAAPYFRIFNPVLQGEKFDPEGAYVRQYVPELSELPAKFVHKPWEAPADVLAAADVKLGETYPHPMIDRKITRQRALDAYATIKQSA